MILGAAALVLATGSLLTWKLAAQSPARGPGNDIVSEAAIADNPPRYFKLLKHRAEAGNAVAQRLLAKAYFNCLLVSRNPSQFLKANTTHQPEGSPEARIERLARARVKDCAQVEGAGQLTLQQTDHWLNLSAQNGDLAGRAMANLLRHPPFDKQEAEKVLQEVIASKDPVVVYAYGEVMGSSVTRSLGESHAPLVSGHKTKLAWMLAGCRMGNHCGPDSMLATDLCLFQGICAPGDYEQGMKSRLKSDAERETLDQQIQMVLDAVTK